MLLTENWEQQQKNEFQAEIDLVKKIGRHDNIIPMYGYSSLGEPYCIVFEYAEYGDLLRYLRKHRQLIQKVNFHSVILPRT